MWACDTALTSNIVSSFNAAGPVFTQALQSFLGAQCALVGDHLWPFDATQDVLDDPYYDFIVVGAGSAGAVVANRLSEIADWKVLLVEAGGNPTLATEIPQLFYNTLKSPQDWNYTAQPQEGASLSFKNGTYWPRGKVLGGSSSVNIMMYVRGSKLDYDEWAANGNIGWSYNDVLPYFKKSENYTKPATDEIKKYHGTGGYLNVDDPEDYDDLEKIFVKAIQELGLQFVEDINGPLQMGVGKLPNTIKDGTRQSTARAFLSPVKDRKNLHVIKNTLATKILFEPNSNIVKGVLLNKNGKSFEVYTKKELILSAGAINTPQLMLLSGLGPKQHLEDLKIETKADLPVGENLQDHLFVEVSYILPGDTNMCSLENISKGLIEYIFNKTGIFSNLRPHRIATFVNTTDPTAKSADIQWHYILLPPNSVNLIDKYEKHGLSDEFRKKFEDLNNENYILVIPISLLRPKSKGRILLKSTDPYDHPLIYANYFDDEEDLKTILRAMKQYVLRFGDTKTFKNAGFKLKWVEIEACKKFKNDNDNFLECMARKLTFSMYHPTGTAKMGPDNDITAVVNPELKVRNVKRLRVIDASIMPIIVRGNTNAPTIMIGEKGADMIKKEWLNMHNEL